MNAQNHAKMSPADLFNKDMSQSYDAKNSRLAAISDNMHFLIRLILKDLPPQARVLCVGVGTGAEILSLAAAYPSWSFVGVDPSASMLAVCQQRLTEAGIMERCALIEGYVHDVPAAEDFDAVLSILVAHFVARQDRLGFYQDMQKRLKPGGRLINTEISFALDTPEYPAMLKNWASVQELMGATPESLAALPDILRDKLSVISPADTEHLLRDSGFPLPVRFFQSFMIHGWYGLK